MVFQYQRLDRTGRRGRGRRGLHRDYLGRRSLCLSRFILLKVVIRVEVGRIKVRISEGSREKLAAIETIKTESRSRETGSGTESGRTASLSKRSGYTHTAPLRRSWQYKPGRSKYDNR